jgi:hypothetical protein
MKKQVLLLAISAIFVTSGYSQINTPSGSIQGQTTGGNVGIGSGTTDPDGSLHIRDSFMNLLLLQPIQETIDLPGGLFEVAIPKAALVVDNQTGSSPSGEVFTILPNGRTRIGTFPFTVTDNLAVRTQMGVYNNATNYLKINALNNASEILWSDPDDESPLVFKHVNSGAVPLRMTADGKVGVNTDYFPGNHSLYVKGSIITEGLTVLIEGDWADYVFEPDYSLMSLFDLNQYIRTYKRLPGMPSATEVAESGVEIGETVRLLTEKVEEITLYLIHLNEENELLKTEIQTLKGGN